MRQEDIKDNLKLERLEKLDEKTTYRLVEKYTKAIFDLNSGVVNE